MRYSCRKARIEDPLGKVTFLPNLDKNRREKGNNFTLGSFAFIRYQRGKANLI